MGAKLTGRSAFEKELQAWIDGPTITFTCDYEPGLVNIVIPPRYEDS